MPSRFYGLIVVLSNALMALLYPSAAQVKSEKPATSDPTWIDEARINNAAAEPENWLAYGRTYEEQRFSPLEQIDQATVSRLGLAWTYDMKTIRGLEATPIVVDGLMFISSAWSKVYAFEAATGTLVWFFDPNVPPEWRSRACCDVVNRGVAVYRGKVYVGSLDGRLIALDATTGKQLWEVDTIIDRTRDYTITGAPRAAKGKVFIGNGGAEFGVRGYATAYDAETGEQVWRFFTVPGDPAKPFEHPEMEMAASTWNGNWWEFGGGGTVWNSIVYDPDFDQVYLGVGNGSPWVRDIRSPGGGDNLFLASIVALDVETGKMKWYYQTTPADNWDYTAVQDMMLADMEVDGVERKVLMQAPKNGFFYVIDRASGELLRAHDFVTTTWATHVDMASGRPVENPEFNYQKEPRWILPGPLGGHNWQAMSYDARTGIVYLPAMDTPFVYHIDEDWKETGQYPRRRGAFRLGVDLPKLSQLILNTPDAPKARGYLKAFDPLSGEEKWAVEFPHHWNGGVLATQGGLVFQGNSLGEFSAYSAATGDLLWTSNAYRGFIAPPVSYMVDGIQYVAILAGTGGGSGIVGDAGPASEKYRNEGLLLVYKLDGAVAMPVPLDRNQDIPVQPAITASTSEIERGERLYNQSCLRCHGFFAHSSGVVPDLRMMDEATRRDFKVIVRDGLLRLKGMPGFAGQLTDRDIDQIRAYITSQAAEDRRKALEESE